MILRQPCPTACTLTIVFVLEMNASGRGAEPFFEEAFIGSVQSPNLDGEDFFRLANGEGIQRISSSSHSDRRYVRTVVGAYNKLNFVYELTFTIAVDEIVFIGIGQGEPDSAFREPTQSLNLRIHSPGLVNGKVEIHGAIIGNLARPGPHRIQITKIGDSMTYAVDSDFDGQFEADMSYTVESLTAVAPFLRDDDSHLFFGNSEVATTYRDLVIAPNPNAARFRRDDANGDRRVDIADPVGVLAFLFLGGPQGCLDAADFDNNGQVNIADPIALISYLFLGSFSPRNPFGACGYDPDQDDLGCETFPACG